MGNWVWKRIEFDGRVGHIISYQFHSIAPNIPENGKWVNWVWKIIEFDRRVGHLISYQFHSIAPNISENGKWGNWVWKIIEFDSRVGHPISYQFHSIAPNMPENWKWDLVGVKLKGLIWTIPQNPFSTFFMIIPPPFDINFVHFIIKMLENREWEIGCEK